MEYAAIAEYTGCAEVEEEKQRSDLGHTALCTSGSTPQALRGLGWGNFDVHQSFTVCICKGEIMLRLSGLSGSASKVTNTSKCFPLPWIPWFVWTQMLHLLSLGRLCTWRYTFCISSIDGEKIPYLETYTALWLPLDWIYDMKRKIIM